MGISEILMLEPSKTKLEAENLVRYGLFEVGIKIYIPNGKKKFGGKFRNAPLLKLDYQIFIFHIGFFLDNLKSLSPSQVIQKNSI